MSAQRLPVLRAFIHPQLRLFASIGLLLATAIGIAPALHLIYSVQTDFRGSFLYAAANAWHGISPYGQAPIIPGTTTLGGPKTANETPWLLLLLGPFQAMSTTLSRSIWVAAEASALVGMLVVLYRSVGWPSWPQLFLVLSLLALFVPLREDLYDAQTSLLVGFFVALATWLHLTGRSRRGGVALGLAVMLKLTPILLVAYYFWRGDRRLCWWTGITLATATAVTVAIGWAGYWPGFFANTVLSAQGTADVLNQSLLGLILRSWDPLATGYPLGALPISLLVIAYCARAALLVVAMAPLPRLQMAEPERVWLQVGTIILVTVLCQPIAWIHHFVQCIFLIPLYVHLISRGMVSGKVAIVVVAAFLGQFLLSNLTYFAVRDTATQDLAHEPWLVLAASIPMLCMLLVALAPWLMRMSPQWRLSRREDVDGW